MAESPKEMIPGEILPAEVIEHIRAFLEARRTGQFILHVQEGVIQKEQETTWRVLDKKKE